MTALILHADPETCRRLEQDYLAAGAMVFASGNATEHYEVSNPHHHAAIIYQDYNKAIFGDLKSRELAIKALYSLVIESDVVVCPEDITDPVLSGGMKLAEHLGIPVVRTVSECFTGVDASAPGEGEKVAPTLWCSGCKVSGDCPLTVSEDTPLFGKAVSACSEKKPSCRFFPSVEEAELDALSDESISDLEKQQIPYFTPDAEYTPGQPVIKRGAIVFPGGVV